MRSLEAMMQIGEDGKLTIQLPENAPEGKYRVTFKPFSKRHRAKMKLQSQTQTQPQLETENISEESFEPDPALTKSAATILSENQSVEPFSLLQAPNVNY